MLTAYTGVVVLAPLVLVVVALGGTPVAALPAAVGGPILAVLAAGAIFGALWFVAYGALFLVDRRTTLLEPDGARPRFEAGEAIVRHGMGAFETSGASRLGKLALTTTRLRFRAFRMAGRPVDESIDLGLVANVRVVQKGICGLRARHLLLTLRNGESRVFYGYDEASWRDALGDAVNERRGATD